MSILTSPRIEKLAAAFLLAASVFVAILAINQLRGLWQTTPVTGSVITVEGTGKVTAIPDVATISFTVMGEGKSATIAQGEATKKNNVAIELMKEKGIEDKFIKTTSYNVQPKYSYPQPCYGGACVYDEQRIIGYTVTQTTEVKIKDSSIEVGDILSALGDAGISQLYGPNFTVEDIDAKREEARSLAIKDAREKAAKLASDLGVSIVRIVSYGENGGGYPMPMYARSSAMGGDMMTMEAKVSPEVPSGESEISSNVSVTYEIR